VQQFQWIHDLSFANSSLYIAREEHSNGNEPIKHQWITGKSEDKWAMACRELLPTFCTSVAAANFQPWREAARMAALELTTLQWPLCSAYGQEWTPHGQRMIHMDLWKHLHQGSV